MPRDGWTIPGKRKDLLGWANELIKECEGSRQARATQYAAWRQLFFVGSAETWMAPYNKIYPHIDTLASYLYSPKSVRFMVEYDQSEDEDSWAQGQIAANHLSRVFNRRGINFACEQANVWSLVKGSMFVKLIWGQSGVTPYLVDPEMMGVLREDVCGLENQEAFFHSMYLTPPQFERQLGDHPRKAEIMREIQPTPDMEVDPMRESMFKQIIIGEQQPITQGPPTGRTVGNVNWISGFMPFVPPETAKDLIRLDELWVLDKEREDWTTIQIAQKRAIIEGDIRHRNLCDIQGHQPFVQFCPNAVHGYFWGMSEIAPLCGLQDGLNDAIANIDRIESLQAHPPIFGTGVTGFDEDKRATLMSPDGWMAEAEQGAKLENMAPKLPDSAYANLRERIDWFNDVSGLTSTLRGENQPGVRAGGHAETLVRTGSPRIVDRALKTESDVADVGDLLLRIEQLKNPRKFTYGKTDKDGNRKAFLLEQLPEDFIVSVDSHSSSPAFSEEGKQLAFALYKAQAISAVDLLRLTHPPREDSLVAAADRRAEDQAKLLREHPELLRKQMNRKK